MSVRYKCKNCGKIFYGVSQQMFCSKECRLEYNELSPDGLKEEEKYKKVMKKYHNDEFDKTLRELDEYNRQNGTYMSYGDYIYKVKMRQDNSR